jgi:small subunit ribosomal protein S6
MADPNATYDLTLLLDAETDGDTRERILADVETMIAEGGTIVSVHDWGRRTMAYEIKHKTDAEYHLIQFHAAGRELLERLDRTLRITDGVTRYRIIRLKPGTPGPPETAPQPTTAAPAETPVER